MKKLFFISSIIVFLSCDNQLISNWQVPEFFEGELLWVKLYGGSNEDIAHSIIETSDGGYAVLGNTKSQDGDVSEKNTSDRDWFFLKLDQNGDILWKKIYGGSGDDHGHSVIQTEDEGYILAGYTSSKDGDIDSISAYDDILQNGDPHDKWIIKIDQFGNILWQNVYGFKGHDHAYSIIPTRDGGYFLNGFLDVSASEGAGNYNVGSKKHHGVGEFWCHKIDSNGNLQWRKYYGGSNNDRSYDAIQTLEGDFIIVGTSESNDFEISNSKGSYDMWVIKLDNNGNLIWEKSFGGKGYDGGNAVIENSYGNIMILGQTNSLDNDITDPLGSSDFFLVNMTKKGEILNIENLGTSNFDSGKSIMELDDGSHYLLGHTTDISSVDGNLGSDILFIKTLPNGVFIENQKVGGSGTDIGYDFTQISDGSIIIVGSTDSENGIFSKNNGKEDVFIIKWN